MRTISVSAAKNQLSALLREVRAGRTITITDRGIPVAQLSPVGPSRGISPGAVELAQQGLLTLPARAPSTRWLDPDRPDLERGRSAVQELVKERAGDR
jgi:prevent-host-death family protein